MAKPPTINSRPEGYVFIVTYGRSGSTLLQNLLNSIDGYCIRGENGNAVGPLARAWHNVRQSRVLNNLSRAKVETSTAHPWYGGEKINANGFGRALADAFYHHVLAPPPGTRVAGFKEIRWISDAVTLPVTLNFLFNFLPNSRFVFNTRDHDEVARSAWWASMDPVQVKAQLEAAEVAYARYRANNPARCIHLHYNDYVADREALKPLFDFLGEPFDRAQVDAVMDHRLMHMKDD